MPLKRKGIDGTKRSFSKKSKPEDSIERGRRDRVTQPDTRRMNKPAGTSKQARIERMSTEDERFSSEIPGFAKAVAVPAKPISSTDQMNVDSENKQRQPGTRVPSSRNPDSEHINYDAPILDITAFIERCSDRDACQPSPCFEWQKHIDRNFIEHAKVRDLIPYPSNEGWLAWLDRVLPDYKDIMPFPSISQVTQEYSGSIIGFTNNMIAAFQTRGYKIPVMTAQECQVLWCLHERGFIQPPSEEAKADWKARIEAEIHQERLRARVTREQNAAVRTHAAQGTLRKLAVQVLRVWAIGEGIDTNCRKAELADRIQGCLQHEASSVNT